MTLHDTEELDDDLGARADEHLALATALSVDNVVLCRILACTQSMAQADTPSSR